MYDKHKDEDPEMLRKAHEAFELTSKGEDLARSSMLTATKRMETLVLKIKKPDARYHTLMHHGVYIGIGAQLAQTVMPQYHKMKEELLELNGSEVVSQFLCDIWMAKVLMELVEGLNDLEK